MVFKAPQNISYSRSNISVFLAGSIEMGTAENWQETASTILELLDIDVFNPRRDDWDSSWTQDALSPQFYQQVSWELNAMNHADYIIMYFDPNTKSPISLLELGLHASSGKMLVVCPKGFWKKGNVDMVCQILGIDMFENVGGAIDFIKENL